MSHYVVLDDSIRAWDGITLDGDPNPLFKADPVKGRAQRELVPFSRALELFQKHDFKDRNKFAVIGFHRKGQWFPKNYCKLWGFVHSHHLLQLVQDVVAQQVLYFRTWLKEFKCMFVPQCPIGALNTTVSKK